MNDLAGRACDNELMFVQERPIICEAIDILATRARLSHAELARRTGLDPSMVLRVRNGERDPSSEAIDLLDRAIAKPGAVYKTAAKIAESRAHGTQQRLLSA